TCELRFEVSDSGIGISPEQQKKIFNVFEQAESGTTRKFGGTGLGLAISKRIIELMGGQISIDSELGKGSKFIFTVKLNSVSDDTHLRRLFDNTEDVFANLNNEFSGKKMLLAEDIEINREILMSLLEGTGLIIDTAENGRQALDKVTASPGKYDIIFMDMQMPEMDGLEASRHIREFEAKPENINNHRQIPIIAMTANVFKEDIDNCLAAGMNDHIGKPIELNIVFEKLKKFLQ
ncbi:MAG: response regulator, partial [Treponema sp.]|nr:response regulator [Treponema sp.]